MLCWWVWKRSSSNKNMAKKCFKIPKYSIYFSLLKIPKNTSSICDLVIAGLVSRFESRFVSRLVIELDLVTSRCELVLETALLAELVLSSFDLALLRFRFDFESCLCRRGWRRLGLGSRLERTFMDAVVDVVAETKLNIRSEWVRGFFQAREFWTKTTLGWAFLRRSSGHNYSSEGNP